MTLPCGPAQLAPPLPHITAGSDEPTVAVPPFPGSAEPTTKTACTPLLAGDVAAFESPLPFVAITRTRSLLSASVGLYDAAVAAAMSVQLDMSWPSSHDIHWYP